MLITLPARRRWGIALMAAVLSSGMAGITPVVAQSVPVAPVVVPVAPGALVVTAIPPPMTVGSAGKSRGGVIWSKSGRADVDIAIDEHHGRTVVP